MLKICHVNLARGYRGGERQTELLIRALSRHAIAQSAIVRRDDELGRRLADVEGLDLQPIGKPFLRHVRLARGSLLHAHESRAAHFAHACRWLVGARYVITRRVDNRPAAGPVTRAVYSRASAVVAISSAIARVLSGYERTLSPRVIPSAQAELPVDAAAVARIRARWPGRFLVGHAAALDNSQKGQLYLIRAARRFQATHPDVHVVLLGSGKDEAALKREAAGLTNVTFEGHVRNVGDWLSAFDLFAFPSLHEGLGSVLLDAMSLGLPIVASRVDGIPEIVREGENGLLVPPADEDALAVAILRLHADPELRSRLVAAGQRIAQEYTPERMARSYLDLYGEIDASR